VDHCRTEDCHARQIVCLRSTLSLAIPPRFHNLGESQRFTTIGVLNSFHSKLEPGLFYEVSKGVFSHGIAVRYRDHMDRPISSMLLGIHPWTEGVVF
jgi:hypothetical protein